MPLRSMSCEPALQRTSSGNTSDVVDSAASNASSVSSDDGGGEGASRKYSHPIPIRSDSDATNNYSSSLVAPSPAYKADSAEPDFARGRTTRLSSIALEALGETEEETGDAEGRPLSPSSPSSSVAGAWGGGSSAAGSSAGSVCGDRASPGLELEFESGGDSDIADTGFRPVQVAKEAVKGEEDVGGKGGEDDTSAAAAAAAATERRESPTVGLAQRRGANFGPTSECDITHGSDIDWGKWGQWVTCVCVVGFDLETGNAVERVVPSHAKLLPEDAKNISFLSFPDSNNGTTGDTSFHFRVRASTGILPRFTTSNIQKRYFFGSVYFRQIPDPSIRRGYYQKSVVVISTLPYPKLFATLAKVIARSYFEHGNGVLDAACSDICGWPSPDSPGLLRLPLLENEIKVCVPKLSIGYQVPVELALPNQALVASLCAVDLGVALRPVLPQVQLLWELMLTAEPVIIRAATPQASSRLVLALVSLVAPLQYCGDFRPYFTIHDSDCMTYVKQKKRFPCAVLGVTNPYFEQAFQTWPTIVRVESEAKPGEGGNGARGAHGGIAAKMMAGAALSSSGGSPRMGFGGSSGGALRKPGVVSSHRQMIENDKVFLKTILQRNNDKSSRHKLANDIRDHFWGLTRDFMIPFERYFARLMPLKSAMSPFKQIPQMPTFDPKDFLKTLPQLEATQTTKCRNWTAVYSRFIKSPNFRGWLLTKEQQANKQLLKIYLDQVCSAEVTAWCQGKAEIEIMDLFIRIRDATVKANKARQLDAHLLELLLGKVEGIRNALPEDVRSSVLLPPLSFI